MYWVLFSRTFARGGGVNTLTPLATWSPSTSIPKDKLLHRDRLHICTGYLLYTYMYYKPYYRKRQIHTVHDMLRPCMKRRRVCIQGHRTAIEVELSARARSVLSFLSLLSFRVSITDQCVEASFDKSSVERTRCFLFEGAFGLLCF